MTEMTILLSDSAAKRIAEVTAGEPDGTLLRIAVIGGGCSGFQYTFDLTQTTTEEDMILERNGSKVAIDSVSQMYLEGSEIDFVDDLIGQSFQIRNPNAIASCGCGTSFTI